MRAQTQRIRAFVSRREVFHIFVYTVGRKYLARKIRSVQYNTVENNRREFRRKFQYDISAKHSTRDKTFTRVLGVSEIRNENQKGMDLHPSRIVQVGFFLGRKKI